MPHQKKKRQPTKWCNLLKRKPITSNETLKYAGITVSLIENAPFSFRYEWIGITACWTIPNNPRTPSDMFPIHFDLLRVHNLFTLIKILNPSSNPHLISQIYNVRAEKTNFISKTSEKFYISSQIRLDVFFASVNLLIVFY